MGFWLKLFRLIFAGPRAPSVAMKVVGSLLCASCLFVATSAQQQQLRGNSAVGEVVAEEASRDLAIATGEVHADTFPDVTTGLDVAGPYLEEPHEDEADSPRPAKHGWENATSLQAAVSQTWGGSFCTAHHTGFFCDGTTRVRCCQNTWGFVKCGTTVRSSSCGWRGGGFPSVGGGGVWHIHQGWRQSSFCTSHHTGWFCASHKKVHCCNDYGHFVDCTTRSQTSWRC